MRSRWIATIAIAVLVAAAAIAYAATRGGVPDGAAFVYRDHTVTTTDLDRRVDALRALYGITAPSEAEERDTFMREAAKSYAMTLVLDDEARAHDISVSDKRARDLLDKYISDQFGTREAFVQALGNVRTSEKAVLEEIARQDSVARLREKIVGDVTVDDQQLRTAFEQRKDELNTPETRRLGNIVVSDEPTATAVAKRLRDGEPVAKVAADVSIDESTRDAGGDLGFLAETQMEEPVATAAFGVKKGQVYGPVEGAHGWNVGVVVDVREPVKADLAIIGEQFRQQLVAEEGAARWTRWLTKVMRKADIRYADAYRPKDPDTPPDQTTPSTTTPQGGAR